MTWQQFLWIIIPSIFAILIWIKYYRIEEPFISTEENQYLIELYLSVLDRNPTSAELSKHIKALDRNEYTMGELEIRLYNSEEYKRLVKTQSNVLSPEMSRMIEEKEVIAYVKDLYQRVLSKKPIKDILLPLRDLFIYFDYNAYKFMALLRHTKYMDFEEEFKSNKNLSKEALIELYLKTFDDELLTKNGEALRKTEKLTPLGRKFESKDITGVSGGKIDGALLGLSDTDTNLLLKYLKEKGLFGNKDEAGMYLANGGEGAGAAAGGAGVNYYPTELATGAGSMCTGQRVYLPTESKIRQTSFGFSVPEKHPPVCIPVGGKSPVSPVVFGDLLGTSLDDANHTQVGSIMPKFEYNEYIDIPWQGVPSGMPMTGHSKNTPGVAPAAAPTAVAKKGEVAVAAETAAPAAGAPSGSAVNKGAGIGGTSTININITETQAKAPTTSAEDNVIRGNILDCISTGGVYKNNTCGKASDYNMASGASSYTDRCKASDGDKYTLNNTSICSV